MKLEVVDELYRHEVPLVYEEIPEHQLVRAKTTLEVAIDDVLHRLGKAKIRLLRFHGHGLEKGGVQIVGAGKTNHPGNKQVISFSRKEGFRGGTQLKRLRGHFTEDGLIEFHGCYVADHKAGRELLWLVSDLLQVAVRAASGLQGPDRKAFNNNVYEAKPGNNGVPKTVMIGIGLPWPEPGALERTP
jgi:hypothetical protein